MNVYSGNADSGIGITLGLAKTIPGASFQIRVEVLKESRHQMMTLIIICFWIMAIHFFYFF